MNSYIIVNKLSDSFNDDSIQQILIAVDRIQYIQSICEGMSKIGIDGKDDGFYIRESPAEVKSLIYAGSDSMKVGF